MINLFSIKTVVYGGNVRASEDLHSLAVGSLRLIKFFNCILLYNFKINY